MFRTRAWSRVLLVAAVLQLHQQLILDRMVWNKLDSIGDRVLSIFIVLDISMEHALVSLIDPRCQLNLILHRSPCAQV